MNITPPPASATTLADPDTPFAVVDVHKALRNIERLARRADRLGVTLRPHVKTAKSLDIAALMHGGTPCPVTVSTLAEAEAFADGGVHRHHVRRRHRARTSSPRHRAPAPRRHLRVLLDSREQAAVVADASRKAGSPSRR